MACAGGGLQPLFDCVILMKDTGIAAAERVGKPTLSFALNDFPLLGNAGNYGWFCIKKQ
jgi:hypothetical protein